MHLTASLHLTVKQCREYMREGERKVKVTGSSRFHITLWNKIGSDDTFWYIDGLINSVFAKNPIVSEFFDSDTQNFYLNFYFIKVYRPNTLVDSLR